MTENEPKELMESILHPVRMRILLALTGSSGLTPLQLSEQLDDIPQATLYRHIGRLSKVGLLQVADERRVRGTVEKVYTLSQTQSTRLDEKALAGLSKEDHLRFFTSFTVTLIDEFSRYLKHTDNPDYRKDGVGYSQLVLKMTDEELAKFGAAINAVVIPYLGLEESPERKKRIFATIMIPEETGK